MIKAFKMGKDLTVHLSLKEEPSTLVESQFDLQRRKETLGHGIVPIIPPPIHRALDFPGDEPLLVPHGSALTTLIGMIHQRHRGLTQCDRQI